ncbi:NAD(P)/FAD-dependent oxidoreductase [Isachenkonia alkalipeptolytica]|uniref:NAD(P)/FAD-dependent oxidoreductase n=1 Tax=Isachenkonia alkalipeptolytica TaxID=2565777 RepID=A0AA43XK75_9CLOT|nr:NAD(P)/FAD-dependent oxidoreductase [Isachenkonia alkalipeptolytica]NBG87816.1 NAD(P)/FAD-dependent oxidoreductase [Isachenkonia alkalipeptolytica]
MYDVIIIGAGVIGTAVARELSKYQGRVAILEKNPEVCQGTTKANSAIVHGGYDARHGTLKGKLNKRGVELYPGLAKALNFPYQRCGSMVLAFNREEEQKLWALMENGKKNGVEGLELLTGEEVRQIEPGIAPEVTKVLYAKNAGITCPFNMTFALLENAMENGTELFVNTEVKGIKEFGEGLSLFTPQGEFQGKMVINAAGVHSDRIAEMIGDRNYKITPNRGEYRILDRKAGDTVSHVIFQTPTPDGKGVLVAPTVHGNIIVGPTSDGIDSPEDTRTTKAGIEKVDRSASKAVPKVPLRESIRIFSGIRASVEGSDFIIEPSKTAKGLMHLIGIDSPGLASAPAIGEMVVGEIQERLSLEKKQNFIEKRRAIPHFEALSNGEKEGLLKANPRYKKIICRCEMITEGEILEAIHRRGGATTLDGIKRRVRPGSGRCQGGFCGPRVLEILSRELQIPMEEIRKEGTDSKLLSGKLKGALK